MRRDSAGRLVLEKAEAFDDSAANLKRLHTIVVCKEDEGFFIAQLSCSMSEVPEMLPNTGELNGYHVSASEVFPPWQDGAFTLGHSCASTRCYLKQQSLLCFRRGDDSEINLMLHEARVMEQLKKFQHPNIAMYHGCVKRNNLIIGQCLEKYTETQIVSNEMRQR